MSKPTLSKNLRYNIGIKKMQIVFSKKVELLLLFHMR